MAQKTKAELLAMVESLFPDNVSNEITPEDVRDFLTDLTDSSLNRSSDSGTAIPKYFQATVSLINGQIEVAHTLNLKPHSVDIINTSGQPVPAEWKAKPSFLDSAILIDHNAAVSDCRIVIEAIQ